MDAEGIYAQVLYPNVGGFGSGGFLRLKEPALMLECVRAYNDFLVDWCERRPQRLLPVAAMPFWDVDGLRRGDRARGATGHRAMLACSKPTDFGQPPLCRPPLGSVLGRGAGRRPPDQLPHRRRRPLAT